MASDPDTKLDFLLEQLESQNVSLEDLLRRRDTGSSGPTLREMRGTVLDAISNGRSLETRTTYIDFLIDGEPCSCTCNRCRNDDHCNDNPHCAKRYAGIGDVAIRSWTPAEINRAGRAAAQRAVAGPRSGDGSGAARHVHGAARHVVTVLLAERNLLSDPLEGMRTPPRTTKRTARSLDLDAFERIVEEICLGGDDPKLDTLILAFRIETGARSAGIRNLTRAGLLQASCRVRWAEKRDRVIDRPISPWLMDQLLSHVAERSDPDAGPDGPVFHYRPDKPYRSWDGHTWSVRTGVHPVGKSRFETINRRIRKAVPEAAEAEFRQHDVRHQIGSVIERTFGHSAAQAYLNHVPDNPTSTYTRARESEIERQHRWLTGNDEPTS